MPDPDVEVPDLIRHAFVRWDFDGVQRDICTDFDKERQRLCQRPEHEHAPATDGGETADAGA